MTPENHPFAPFLPAGAKILMLGSFPPPEKRWCMDFYYPNFGNDMWRIMGLIWFNDKDHFISGRPDRKAGTFDKNRIMDFCTDKGIAMYDTACKVIRLKDNASDKFLQVTEATDIEALLEHLPDCKAIVTTGQKATDVLTEHFGCDEPPMGGHTSLGTGYIKLYRLPSSSRAYPLALEKKADAYRNMFKELGMI